MRLSKDDAGREDRSPASRQRASGLLSPCSQAIAPEARARVEIQRGRQCRLPFDHEREEDDAGRVQREAGKAA
jgi:hypothetical protein